MHTFSNKYTVQSLRLSILLYHHYCFLVKLFPSYWYFTSPWKRLRNLLGILKYNTIVVRVVHFNTFTDILKHRNFKVYSGREGRAPQVHNLYTRYLIEGQYSFYRMHGKCKNSNVPQGYRNPVVRVSNPYLDLLQLRMFQIHIGAPRPYCHRQNIDSSVEPLHTFYHLEYFAENKLWSYL
jgi:hypothetical protein